VSKGVKGETSEDNRKRLGSGWTCGLGVPTKARKKRSGRNFGDGGGGTNIFIITRGKTDRGGERKGDFPNREEKTGEQNSQKIGKKGRRSFTLRIKITGWDKKKN